MTHMASSVGVRELRQNLSKHLERVKGGETLTVTERGREVARLVPTNRGSYAELGAQFGASIPSERLEDAASRLEPRGAPAGTTDDALGPGRRSRS